MATSSSSALFVAELEVPFSTIGTLRGELRKYVTVATEATTRTAQVTMWANARPPTANMTIAGTVVAAYKPNVSALLFFTAFVPSHSFPGFIGCWPGE
jgi:hypothetical protein